MNYILYIILVSVISVSCQKSQNNKSLKKVVPQRILSKNEVCKQLVVDAQKLLGKDINQKDFSNLNIENFKITPDEFNKLPNSKQKELYRQLKPLDMYVKETKQILERDLKRAETSIYGFLIHDKIDLYKKSIKELTDCLK